MGRILPAITKPAVPEPMPRALSHRGPYLADKPAVSAEDMRDTESEGYLQWRAAMLPQTAARLAEIEAAHAPCAHPPCGGPMRKRRDESYANFARRKGCSFECSREISIQNSGKYRTSVQDRDDWTKRPASAASVVEPDFSKHNLNIPRQMVVPMRRPDPLRSGIGTCAALLVDESPVRG